MKDAEVCKIKGRDGRCISNKLRIAVYYDEVDGEIWEISNQYKDRIDRLLQNEQVYDIKELLENYGTIAIDKCDYWIRMGDE
jgi:hypothetical protein